MAEICCGVVSESEVTVSSSSCEPISQAARRRRMEIRRIKFVSGVETPEIENGLKRRRLELHPASGPRQCVNAADNWTTGGGGGGGGSLESENGKKEIEDVPSSSDSLPLLTPLLPATLAGPESYPRYGVASVCGRRRDMEDAVAVHPSFTRRDDENSAELHYFGVYDGHGCSHVATKCRDRLHELVREELENKHESTEWKSAMERSFNRMDKEVIARNEDVLGATCRCELQSPECDAVGSTAVVAIVTPDKIIVANCGDSRAVLCRGGKPIPLSIDHKPDRPDELSRIEAAGGRVIYWDGPRVLGVLAMSRAIGDNYLKPYVSSEPEITIIDRTAEDDCLILASDGLWDVVSNDTACGVARMCLKGKSQTSSTRPSSPGGDAGGQNSDKACSDASMLLTKLALARRSSDNVSVVVVDLGRDT